MDLKKRPSLRGLMANRCKEVTPLEAPKTQTSANLPPPLSLPPVDQGLRVNPDLKKKRPSEELEEREMPPQRGVKQQRRKTLVIRGQSLWRAEITSRFAVRSARGLL